jgi:hypothetical protein
MYTKAENILLHKLESVTTISPFVMLLHQHSDSHFSGQPLTTFCPEWIVLTGTTPLIKGRG